MFNRLILLMAIIIALAVLAPTPLPAELLAEGEKAPAFFIRDLDGQKRQLHMYVFRQKGKEFVQPIFVIDFFATWCKPCKGMLPYMQKLYEKYKGRNVVFLLVDYTEKKDVLASWLKTNKIKIPAAYDANGSLMAKRFQVEALPTLYVIDREKRVAMALQGGGEKKADRIKKAAKIKKVIDELLARDEKAEE